MDIHYNAFISYRHHPQDIRVATEIHRALERYHIPKAIRKNLKGSLRLFRDKDELPITSNLSDDITRALEHSDYLIVICSTHTRESLWVQREIETFLKTHTYDKVLTVLVDGEPYDTIPEILQYREETDSVTGQVTRVPIEPLSCDWRVGKKAAHREELPRLAAALLHCGYDELRQRQRQYKMRRTVAILSSFMAASLCLMAYFLYTSIIIRQANEDLHTANEEISRVNREIQAANVQIQANYDQALRNQSQYLSSAASERYLAGDRLTAISLAMAALPSEDDPRPYVPAAEQILAEALGIYEQERGVTAAGILECGALVEDFAVTQDGKFLYAADRANRITVWDTQACVSLAVIDLGKSDYRQMQPVGENIVMLLSPVYGSGDPELCCYSPQGQLLWSLENATDVALLDGDTLLVLDYSWLNGGTMVHFLDPATGKQTAETVTISMASSLTPSGFFQETYTTGHPVTLACGSYEQDCVFLLDTQTGEARQVAPFALWPEEEWSSLNLLTAGLSHRGDLLVMVSDASGAMNGGYSNMVITSPANAYVLCYRDGELLWQQTISSYSYNALRTLASIPNTHRILCQKDNVFYIFDGETGQILSRCEAQTNVRSIYVEETRTYGILEDGSYFSYTYSTNQCSALELMDGDLIQAAVADGYFTLVSNSSHITVYRTGAETAWTPFAETPAGYLQWEVSRDPLLAAMSSKGELHLLDMNTGSILWTITGFKGYSTVPLGFSQDGSFFYLQESNNIAVVDVAAGKVRSVALHYTLEDRSLEACGFTHLGEGGLSYLLREESALHLAILDPVTGEVEIYPFLKDLEESRWNIGNNAGPVASGAGFLWLWHQGTLWEFSLTGHSFRPIFEGLEEYPHCAYHEENGLLSVGAGNTLIFFRPGAGETLRIPLGSEKAASVCIRNGEVLVVTNEKMLARFTAAGSLLSRTELHVYTSFYSNAIPEAGETMNIRWQFTPDGELILNVFGLGNLIDTTHWDIRAYMLNFKTYTAESDRLVCYTDYTLGSFPRYTTEQVLAIAREQLNGYRLTDETKAYYGIE